MEKKTITIKTPEELENMSNDNTAIDSALRERFISITNIINSLKAEKDKISEIVLEEYNHESVKTGKVFKTVVYDTLIIDEKLLVELFGQETLDKVKTKVKHIEYIKV